MINEYHLEMIYIYISIYNLIYDKDIYDKLISFRDDIYIYI